MAFMFNTTLKDLEAIETDEEIFLQSFKYMHF